MRSRLAALFASLALALGAARGDSTDAVPFPIEAARDASGVPGGWRHVKLASIDRPTGYVVEPLAPSGLAIRALSDGGASFLARRAPQELDLARTSWLAWRWRAIALPPGDGRAKATDDFAARVCVGFETDWSQESWLARREAAKAREQYGYDPPGTWLHYVWAAKGRLEGEAFDEPYEPERVKCVALRVGPRDGWMREGRDVASDYRRLFGKAPPRLLAIAIMSDADDTRSRAEALYADIAIVASR